MNWHSFKQLCYDPASPSADDARPTSGDDATPTSGDDARPTSTTTPAILPYEFSSFSFTPQPRFPNPQQLATGPPLSQPLAYHSSGVPQLSSLASHQHCPPNMQQWSSTLQLQQRQRQQQFVRREVVLGSLRSLLKPCTFSCSSIHSCRIYQQLLIRSHFFRFHAVHHDRHRTTYLPKLFWPPFAGKFGVLTWVSMCPLNVLYAHGRLLEIRTKGIP